MGSKDDTLRLSTAERIQAMMAGAASARRIKASGASASEPGTRAAVTVDQARAIIEHWPDTPRGVAQKVLEHYGAPHEATASSGTGWVPGPAWS